MKEQAAISVRRRDGAVVAKVVGEIDLVNVAVMENRLLEAVGPDDGILVLDLNGLRHLDSAGIRSLFRLQRVMAQHRQSLRLVVDPGAPLARLLHRTGVAPSLSLDDSVDEALDLPCSG